MRCWRAGLELTAITQPSPFVEKTAILKIRPTWPLQALPALEIAAALANQSRPSLS
jgi:hypothetical protein